MLYLEDYLELIEHLPKELSERLTRIRTNDLEVGKVDTKVKQFFADAKKLDPEQRQCEYEHVLKCFERTTKYADKKVQLADQTHEIMQKLVEKLDGELEKFKLELEADHAGITEQIERRSLQMEADTRLDDTIQSHLSYPNHHPRHLTGFKDRRRSEHKYQPPPPHHRHHPYKPDNLHHLTNGYPVRAKLSHNQQLYDKNTSLHHLNKKQMPHHYYQKYQPGLRFVNGHHCDNSSKTSSPIPFGALSATSAPGSMADDFMPNGSASDLNASGGHYGSNLASFSNDSGFKSAHKNHNNNLPYSNQHHSALSAALSSATIPSPQSISNMDSSAIQQHSNHKISTNNNREKGNDDLIDPSSPLVGQNPLAAAASQAIAATQQLHQGRRTSSLKASFAAVNAAGFGSGGGGKHLDHAFYNNKEGLGRNALAPMAPDQQAFRYNQHYGKLKNGNSSPLYISVTKSGRPSKRPKHHASHLYPDESPTSISSDNSVFENSESMSSADFIDAGTAFGSASPSFDYTNSSRVSDQSGASAFYQRDETKYCICRQISYGEMVACDNEECEIEWFHYNCVGITQTPKGKWYCPGCASKMDLHHHNTSSQQAQTHKKRSRKELIAN